MFSLDRSIWIICRQGDVLELEGEKNVPTITMHGLIYYLGHEMYTPPTTHTRRHKTEEQRHELETQGQGCKEAVEASPVAHSVYTYQPSDLNSY